MRHPSTFPSKTQPSRRNGSRTSVGAIGVYSERTGRECTWPRPAACSVDARAVHAATLACFSPQAGLSLRLTRESAATTDRSPPLLGRSWRRAGKPFDSRHQRQRADPARRELKTAAERRTAPRRPTRLSDWADRIVPGAGCSKNPREQAVVAVSAPPSIPTRTASRRERRAGKEGNAEHQRAQFRASIRSFTSATSRLCSFASSLRRVARVVCCATSSVRPAST